MAQLQTSCSYCDRGTSEESGLRSEIHTEQSSLPRRSGVSPNIYVAARKLHCTVDLRGSRTQESRHEWGVATVPLVYVHGRERVGITSRQQEYAKG